VHGVEGQKSEQWKKRSAKVSTRSSYPLAQRGRYETERVEQMYAHAHRGVAERRKGSKKDKEQLYSNTLARFKCLGKEKECYVYFDRTGCRGRRGDVPGLTLLLPAIGKSKINDEEERRRSGSSREP